MQGYQYRSEFARKYYNQGRDEGRDEGRVQGLRDAVLAFARARLDAVTADDQALIEAAHDEHTLTELIDALTRAQTPSEARAAFARAVVSVRTR